MTVLSCGKATYTTRRRAKQAARVVKSVGKGNRKDADSGILRPYQCRTCGQWHLTSSPYRY